MVTVPLSGTDIRFLSGVPNTSDYKNSRWFDDLLSQTNYFLAKTPVHTMAQCSFQRIEGGKGHYIRVDKSIDDLWNTNYIMFRNTDYNSKWFYAFVTNLEYKNDKLTHVHFEIDVLHTWMFDMQFKPSYIVREHCDQYDANGQPIINTQDEGLNYGTDYEVVSVDQWLPYDDLFFLVIIAKTPLHDGTTKAITPILNGLPQALTYYVHPFRLNNTVPIVHINSQDFQLSSPIDVLTNIFSDSDAVNNVVSMYVTDFIGGSLVDVMYDGSTLSLSNAFLGVQVSDPSGTSPFNTIYLQEMLGYSTAQKTIGDKYDGYKPVKESKLLMYPYSLTIIDDFKGNRKVIKNEYINDTNLSLRVTGSMGTSNKVSYAVDKYLQDSDSPDVAQLAQILNLENALINSDPNDLAIMSDYLAAFMQGNRNQLNNQKDQAVFDGTIGAVSSGVGAIASAMTGNVAGVASSAVGAVKSVGDSVLKIQGINAKLKDINNMPPALSKMGSNTAFDYGNNYTGVYVIKKQITNEYIRKLENFFNMFGYKVNEVKTPNLHTRQYWNFIQTENCYITGDMNNNDLQMLRNIFDSGITLWHTEQVGSYDLDNGVI